MRELLYVVGFAGAMLTASALFLVPWWPLAWVGAGVLAIGFVVGVPTGIHYHVLLYRALSPRGLLPRNWIWRPLSLHDRLLPEQRRPVLRSCHAGAAGFAAMCVGLWLLGTAVVSAMVQTG